VVGQCDGGSKVIVYARGEGSKSDSSAEAPKQPADNAAPASAASSGK
jgi:hypothetical protein